MNKRTKTMILNNIVNTVNNNNINNNHFLIIKA